MRITKKPINADNIVDDALVDVAVDAPVEVAPVDELVEVAPAVPCYDACIEHIHQAIDCLAECANTTNDAKAKEAIANLSVVLLDLQ